MAETPGTGKPFHTSAFHGIRPSEPHGSDGLKSVNGEVLRKAGEEPTGCGASMPKATAPVDRAAFANVAAGHMSALDPGRPVASMRCGARRPKGIRRLS